jgi:hypothetical protein
MSPNLGIIASSISGHLFTLVGNYDALATVTVPSGGLSSITFAGIPTTGYTHLQIRGIVRDNRSNSGNGSYASLTYNSTGGSLYTTHQLYGNGTTASSYGTSGNSTTEFARIADAGTTSGVFSTFTMDILDYANTNKNKTTRTLAGYDNNGGGQLYLWSGLWASTDAINSINIADAGGTLFSQYSSFALYGVK